MNGVKFVYNSSNGKLSSTKSVDVTYASIKSSCPKTCSLYGNGCYASLGNVGIHVKKCDDEAKNLSALDVARNEAKAIDDCEVSNKYLRLHVAGDSRTRKGSKLINSAVGRWKKRGGDKCWSYTHSWMTIPRSDWNHVSMLASVETTKEAELAKQKGYVPAIVVPEFTSSKAFTLSGSDTKFIPCPAQTQEKVFCDTCRLCFNDDKLRNANRGIAFAAHGIKKNQIKRRLNVIQ